MAGSARTARPPPLRTAPCAHGLRVASLTRFGRGAVISTVGSLLGIKTVLNEFIAYEQLATGVASGALSTRSAMIASYALCGFANFGSLAILLGGLGGIAPERRPDIAELGLRAILSGSLTTFMNACIAGVLL